MTGQRVDVVSRPSEGASWETNLMSQPTGGKAKRESGDGEPATAEGRTGGGGEGMSMED